MTSQAIAHHRLVNQALLHSTFETSHELVQYMGCVQAQDYYGAKWAIGNRISGITDEQIESDFSAGKILRTHVLRPTWHFVSPKDIRWMLKLTAPKVRALSKGLHRQLEIDDDVLKRSKKIMIKTLRDSKHATRDVLRESLAKGKINTDDIRLGLLLMEAELDALICSGTRRGKQFTYALLNDRVPETKDKEHDEAVAELGKRYFFSRGPATVQDFMWWSGLSLKDVKNSIALNKKFLDHEVIDGQTYWFAASMPRTAKKIKTVRLLPAYDEYTVGYRDRSHVIQPDFMKPTGNGIFKATIIVDGQVSGTWKRVDIKKQMHVEIRALVASKKISGKLLSTATKAYAQFNAVEHNVAVIL